jgi:hypothetical protein
VRNFSIFLPVTEYLWVDQIKEDEMGGASVTHGGCNKAYKVSVEKFGQLKHNEMTKLENTSCRYRMGGIDWVHAAQDKEK